MPVVIYGSNADADIVPIQDRALFGASGVAGCDAYHFGRTRGSDISVVETHQHLSKLCTCQSSTRLQCDQGSTAHQTYGNSPLHAFCRPGRYRSGIPILGEILPSRGIDAAILGSGLKDQCHLFTGHVLLGGKTPIAETGSDLVGNGPIDGVFIPVLSQIRKTGIRVAYGLSGQSKENLYRHGACYRGVR